MSGAALGMSFKESVIVTMKIMRVTQKSPVNVLDGFPFDAFIGRKMRRRTTRKEMVRIGCSMSFSQILKSMGVPLYSVSLMCSRSASVNVNTLSALPV